MKKVVLYIMTLCCFACSNQSTTEKYQRSRDNVVDVKDKIVELTMDDQIFSNTTQFYLMDDYLIVRDRESYDKIIHLFDLKTFKHLGATGTYGPGPYELINTGAFAVDNQHKIFYVPDYSKMKIFTYEVDSIIANPNYMHKVKVDMDASIFPDKIVYINDTLSIVRVITPIGTNDFADGVGTWNMLTGEIKKMPYTQPEIEKKRIQMAASPEKNRYVEVYTRHDLFTICDLDGNLISNVYGPHWSSERRKNTEYFGAVRYYKDYIVAAYNGGDRIINDKNQGPVGACCKKLMIFDMDGNYIKTLDVKYNIRSFVCDEQYNRIIFSFDDDIQFGYLDLDGIIG